MPTTSTGPRATNRSVGTRFESPQALVDELRMEMLAASRRQQAHAESMQELHDRIARMLEGFRARAK